VGRQVLAIARVKHAPSISSPSRRLAATTVRLRTGQRPCARRWLAARSATDMNSGRTPRIVPLPDFATAIRSSPTVLTTCFEAVGSRSFARRFTRRMRTAWRSGSCRSVRVSRLAADPERPASCAGPCRLRRALTTATGYVERWPSRHPARHVRRWRRRESRARLVSSAAIVSVVWFTTTSWRRDRICEPYRLGQLWTRTDRLNCLRLAVIVDKVATALGPTS
jgi:hypothetical protein